MQKCQKYIIVSIVVSVLKQENNKKKKRNLVMVAKQCHCVLASTDLVKNSADLMLDKICK